MQRLLKTISLFVVLSALHVSSTRAAVIISTFDSDAEGWTENSGEGSLAYFVSGGNPGGHIQITDTGVGGIPFGSGAFVGPQFLGDLSAFDSGTISLDMATFAGGGGTFPRFGEIQLSGGGDIASLDIAVSAPPSGVWQPFSASLDATSWGKSQSDWLVILSNVTSIGIATDAFDGGDTIGIDNFRIDSNAVPIPPAVWLFGSGMLGLIGIARRKKAA